jgi:type II secretory pathway predicted ATPase ExeA
MYEDYYGFVQPPFSLTPDPRFLYRSESHDFALQQVWQAIRRKEGFIVLSGDIGTGKTTLCRTLLEQFDETTFTALILNPFLSVEELLREVLLSFGVVSKDALKTGRLATASKHELIRTLHDFLLSLVPLHGSAVLIIDEAQHLSPEVLEEIRVLSNLETNDQKLLQIVIVGQLNLMDVLHKSELRQLDQRISIRCLLKALTREEVEAYVTHRLWVARGSTSVTFTPKAFDLVHALSGGVPRVINLLCDRSLMVASQRQVSQITEDHVVGAATHLSIDVPKNKVKGERPYGKTAIPFRWQWLAAAVAVLVVVMGAVAVIGNPIELFRPAIDPPLPRVEQKWLPQGLVPLPEPAGMPVIGPPPPMAGSFSILIGTFDSARQAEVVERALREQRLPIYKLDVLQPAGDVVRRIYIGRYATREEAEQVRARLGPPLNAARVIPGELERMRVIPPLP